MTASRIAPKLYQGSKPPAGPELRGAGFHTVVLCAIEHQPPDAFFSGVELLRCPYDDNGEELTLKEWARITHTATVVAERVKQSRRTLVTCALGQNRSGLVVALALTEIYGCSGKEAVTWVKRRRAHALRNPVFVRALERIPRKHPSYRPPDEQPLIILP